MEFLREFIKNGYLKAIGKMEEYKIILGATSYFDKGILKEEDLIEINEALNKSKEEISSVEDISENSI